MSYGMAMTYHNGLPGHESRTHYDHAGADRRTNYRLETNARCGFRKALSSTQRSHVIFRMCERSPMSHAVSDAQPETRASQAETSGRRALTQRGPRAFQRRNSAPTSPRRRSKGICLQAPRKPPEDPDERKYLSVPLVLEWPFDRTSRYRPYIYIEASSLE
jgi:hypothetical protein